MPLKNCTRGRMVSVCWFVVHGLPVRFGPFFLACSALLLYLSCWVNTAVTASSLVLDFQRLSSSSIKASTVGAPSALSNTFLCSLAKAVFFWSRSFSSS